MRNSARRLLLFVAVVLVSSSIGFAQGGGQSLSGIVVDSGGGVIPGATITAKNNATSQTFEVTSNDAGVFAIPGIAVGTYSVTVTLSGFKTAVMNEVRIVTATQTSVKAVLEIGALSETVQVSSRAELIQSQSTQVSSTLLAEQLNEVPLSSRNALYAVTMLPGVQYGAGGGPRRPASTACRTTRSTSRSTACRRATCCSRPTASSRWSRRAGRGRRDHGDGRGARRRTGPGSVQIQFVTRSGTNTSRRQRLPLLAPAGVQHQLLLQQDQQPAEERGHRAPVRLPPGRSDRASRALRRPRQGVLLLQLRAPVSAVERDADAHAAPARSAGRHLRLQRDRRRRATRAGPSTWSRSRGSNGQISGVRSDGLQRCSTKIRAGTRPHRHGQRPAATATRSQYVYQAEASRQPVRADLARRLQPVGHGIG